MKQFIALALLFSVASCWLKPAPVRYNDNLTELQYALEENLDTLSKAISRADIAQIEQATAQINSQLQDIRADLPDYQSFENDSSLYLGMKAYCNTCEGLIKDQVPHIVQLYKLPDAQYTTQQHLKLEFLLKNFNDTRHKSISTLQTLQQNFAKKYNFKPVEE